jgi:hypothetical protein
VAAARPSVLRRRRCTYHPRRDRQRLSAADFLSPHHCPRTLVALGGPETPTFAVDTSHTTLYVVPGLLVTFPGGTPKGNPVRIRDCPAAVSRNEHPHITGSHEPGRWVSGRSISSIQEIAPACKSEDLPAGAPIPAPRSRPPPRSHEHRAGLRRKKSLRLHGVTRRPGAHQFFRTPRLCLPSSRKGEVSFHDDF